MFRPRLGHTARRFTVLAAATMLVAGLLAVGTTTAQAVDGGHITGTVTNAAGDPIEGVDVIMYEMVGEGDNAYWGPAWGASTDALGNYDIGSLATGTYRVGFQQQDYVGEYYDNQPTVEAATDIVVAAAETVPGIDAVLAPAGHITGTVKNAAGDGIDGVDVYVYEMFDEGNNADWLPTWGLETDSSGNYNFNELAAGTYRIGFSTEQFFEGTNTNYVGEYYDNQPTVEAATDIAVTAGATTSVKDAELTKASSIAGSVTFPDGIGPQTAGDTSVNVVDTSTNQVVRDSFITEDSTYEVGGLGAGTYRVEFARASGISKVAAQLYNGVSESNTDAATPVTIAAGEQEAGINANLVEGGTIDGTVVDSADDPLANCSIRAFTQDNSLVTRAATSGTDGTFSVTGLSTGEYKLAVNGTQDDSCGDGVERFFVIDNGTMTATKNSAGLIAVVVGEMKTLSTDLKYVDSTTPAVSTTSTVTVSPSGSAVTGTAVTVTGTVSPSTAVGSIEILDGTTRLGEGTATGGVFTVETSELKVGDHSLTATFTPANAENYQASTSATVTFTVNAPSVSTTSTVTVSPSGSAVTGDPVTVTGTVSPSTAVGSIEILDGTTRLGEGTATGGVFTVKTSELKVGDHNLTAVFTPTNAEDYQASTSATVTFTVNEKELPAGPPSTNTDQLEVLIKTQGLDVSGTTDSFVPSGDTTDNPLDSLDVSKTFSGTLPWSDTADSFVDVYAYSSPVFLGTFPVVKGKVQITGVDLSALQAGGHYLVFVGQTSGTVSVMAVTVVAPEVAPVVAADDSSSVLPSTGLDSNVPIGAAGILLLLGLGLLIAGRRRRT